MQLTPDQIEVKDKLRDALMTHGAAILEASTGFGKTTLTAELLKTTKSAWFVVHRKRLFKDVVKCFEREGLDYGFIAAGKPYKEGHKIYICMAKTLANRIDNIPEPHLVVIDEAHNVAAKTYDAIASKGRFRILLTATPERTDGQGLGKYALIMVSAPPMSWLIANKRLSPFKYYAPTTADTSQLRSSMGEYTNKSIDDAFQHSTIHGDCIEHYNKYAAGKRAIVFCHSIKAAQQTAEQFNAAGIPAASLESSQKDEESDEISDALESGELLVIATVNMVLEGYDLPAIECVIWKRPTKSLIVSKQGNGRGLRYIEGKTCIILDHVGNYKTHGLPDTPIKWSLEGRKKRESEATIAVRECKVCHACFPPASECPECGAPVQVEERVIKQTKGELMEIKQAMLAEKKRIRESKAAIKLEKSMKNAEAQRLKWKCNTLKEVMQLGINYGYDKHWGLKAWKVMQARKK